MNFDYESHDATQIPSPKEEWDKICMITIELDGKVIVITDDLKIAEKNDEKDDEKLVIM